MISKYYDNGKYFCTVVPFNSFNDEIQVYVCIYFKKTHIAGKSVPDLYNQFPSGDVKAVHEYLVSNFDMNYEKYEVK